MGRVAARARLASDLGTAVMGMAASAHSIFMIAPRCPVVQSLGSTLTGLAEYPEHASLADTEFGSNRRLRKSLRRETSDLISFGASCGCPPLVFLLGLRLGNTF